MACCAEANACPMHKSDSPDSDSQRVISQAQADSCCLSSERQEPGPSTPTFAVTISLAVLGPAIVLPADVPALVLHGTEDGLAPYINAELLRTGRWDERSKYMGAELRAWVAKEIGPIAKPKDIRFGDNLPKTRSGKIMRRLLRSIAKGEAITQDTSTLENPAILEQLSQTN